MNNKDYPAALRGIYGITDDSLTPAGQLLDKAERALAGGISLLQFRCKIANPELKRQQATDLLRLCRSFNTPLIINDDVELCATINADGVHLGASDPEIAMARERLGRSALIGVTCHDSLARAVAAEETGADYVAFGRFFPSHTKPTATPASLQILVAARQEIALPVVAIGGINPDNGASLIAAGADMLAVVHSLFAGDDIEANARQLGKLFENTRQESV